MWTGPVILTLCISAFAFVMSGVALGWQIYSWRRSGPEVTVVRILGISPTPEWHGPKLTPLVGAGPHPGTKFIGVEARNAGRIGTKIQHLGFALPSGETIAPTQDVFGMPINYPSDLPPGGIASVRYDAEQIQQALAEAWAYGLGPARRRGEEKNVRPFATTGHGRFEGEAIDLGYEVDVLVRNLPTRYLER